MSNESNSILYTSFRYTVLFLLFILLCVFGFGVGFGIIYFYFDIPKKVVLMDEAKEHHYFFSDGTVDLGILRTGWSSPEYWGVWSTGKLAILDFPISSKRLKNIKVSLNQQILAGCKKQQIIDVSINNVHATQWIYKAREGVHKKEFNFKINKKTMANKIVMRFKITNPCSPKELGLNADTRKLALGIKKITIITNPLNPEIIIQD